MRILKLLEGLYQELKTFNENVEYFSLLEKEKQRNRKNPIRTFKRGEKAAFKHWINKQVEAKRINPDDLLVDNYVKNNIRLFLRSEVSQGTEIVRRALSDALGYGSFDDLLAAYLREAKGGAA